MVHLDVLSSAKVRIRAGLGRPGVVPVESVLDQALPDHPGLPRLASLHRCAYAASPGPASITIAPNFAFEICWTGFTHNKSVILFLRRVMTTGAIEDLTVWYGVGAVQWVQNFGTSHSLRKLRVSWSPGRLGASISAVVRSQSPPSPMLRELLLSSITFDGGPRGTEEGNFWDVSYIRLFSRSVCCVDRSNFDALNYCQRQVNVEPRNG